MRTFNASSLTPTHFFLLVLLIGVMATVLLPNMELGVWCQKAFTLLGALFMSSATVIALVVQRQFKRAGVSYRPNMPPEKLLVTALFAWSRNPVYVALIVLMIALGFLFYSLYFLGCSVVLFFLLDWYVKQVEEPLLEQTFALSYAQYCAQTPRWLLVRAYRCTK